MDFTEPQLGGVANDVISIQMGYAWEAGWSARIAWRPSGSDEWQERVYAGRDAEEVHDLISDHLAGLLRIV